MLEFKMYVPTLLVICLKIQIYHVKLVNRNVFYLIFLKTIPCISVSPAQDFVNLVEELELMFTSNFPNLIHANELMYRLFNSSRVLLNNRSNLYCEQQELFEIRICCKTILQGTRSCCSAACNLSKHEWRWQTQQKSLKP